MRTHKLITQRVVQNSQEFLLGVFSIKEILKFTRYTEYTILGFNELNDNRPITKDEVQRKLNPSKVNSIMNFLINDPLAIFPTNLVISIPNHVILDQKEEEATNFVMLTLNDKVYNEIEKFDTNGKGDIYLSIIDGQHRVRGIEKAISYLKEEIIINEKMIRSSNDHEKYFKLVESLRRKLKNLTEIELPVTFFIDPVLEYQAMIFSTINRTQTRVPPNLVYSLFGLTKGDSPQKTVLNIVNILNGRENSPFYKRIKLAGSGSKEAIEFFKTGNPVLSQATVIKSILKQICINNQEEENARHVPRKYFLKNPNNNLVFRKFYGENNDDKIVKILFAYFTSIRKVFKDNNGNSIWDFDEPSSRKPKNIFQTTVGFYALIEIMVDILKKLKNEENEKIDSYVAFIKKASWLNIKDISRYSFNNRGKKLLYLDLSISIWPPDKNLNSIDDRIDELNALLNER
jgi:DGQHR domain-containing protein